MNLILIRHGEVEYPVNDQGQKLVYDGSVPLSTLGVLQLENLGKVFSRESVRIDGIFVSPYLRAQQSADAIQSRVEIPMRYTVANLRDVDPNSWIDQTLDAYGSVKGDTYGNPMPGKDHESLDQLALHAQQALDEMYEIAQQDRLETIAAVSHGDRLSALVWMLKHETLPANYGMMKEFYYPNKGEAIGFEIDDTLRAPREGKVWKVPDEIGQGVEWNR